MYYVCVFYVSFGRINSHSILYDCTGSLHCYHKISEILSSTVNDGIQKLDIAEGLKKLLNDANYTVELILDLGYRDVSEMLHVDLYVGKLIVEAAQNVMQVRNPSTNKLK